MRFTLADLKKTIARRKGEPHLVPFLLRPGDLEAQLETLIALFEAQVERERIAFPEDRPAELIGDYRLARCLVLCLSEWYEWRSPEWPEGATEAETAALTRAGIGSSSGLRLALYDAVNDTAGGFLPASERDAFLDAFATRLGLARSTLDDLLRLDADPQQVLVRLSVAPPTPAELALRYNQRAVETVLANAATVEWVIAGVRDGGESLGTLVKRACFLARRMGVQYDVAFEEAGETPPLPLPESGRDREAEGAMRGTISLPKRTENTSTSRHSSRRTAPLPAKEEGEADPLATPHPSCRAAPPPTGEGGGGGVAIGLGHVAEPHARYAVRPDAGASSPPTPLDARLDATDRALVLTLYGPQELTGAPAQYGERLTRLCRALLGYRRDASRPGRAALAGDGLHGTTRVYLHGRPLTFTLDDRLLRLLSPTAPGPNQGKSHPGELPAVEGGAAREPDAYDSALERQLAEEWASLEREHATAGWRLEREPEPLVAGETIMIPDFALSRAGRRIFLEIAGYWRPEYRERKLRKLAALRGSVPLILAAPEAARAELAALGGMVPVLWYRDYLSAPALLALLEREYNDFAARVAALDPPTIRALVQSRGWIASDEAYALLGCYTRAELADVLALLDSEPGGDFAAPIWVEGLGLCAAAWHQALLADLHIPLERAAQPMLPLADLIARVRERRPELARLPESTFETLARHAGLHVTRSSLFAALVSLDTPPERAFVPPAELRVPPAGKLGSSKPQPRRAAKRKKSERGTTPSYSTAFMFEPED